MFIYRSKQDVMENRRAAPAPPLYPRPRGSGPHDLDALYGPAAPTPDAYACSEGSAFPLVFSFRRREACVPVTPDLEAPEC